MLPSRQIFTHVLSCARQIPECLLFLVGNIDYRQLSGPLQPGQIPRVSPVRLDTIAWLLWRQRRGDDIAVNPRLPELAVPTRNHTALLRTHIESLPLRVATSGSPS
jgi:hypothetical protein